MRTGYNKQELRSLSKLLKHFNSKGIPLENLANINQKNKAHYKLHLNGFKK